jgi:NADH-quinone oxidoreductase subunit L
LIFIVFFGDNGAKSATAATAMAATKGHGKSKSTKNGKKKAIKATKHDSHHVHESPPIMSIPLIILAVLAVVAGLAGSPLTENAFQGFVMHSFMLGEQVEHEPNMMVMGLSILVALLGILLAWLKYEKKALPSGVITKDNFFYKLLTNKYYMDELYHYTLIVPTHAIARFVLTFDQRVVDGAVNGIAWVTVKIGSSLRVVQTGNVQNYALYMITGIIILIVWCFRILGLY